MPALSEQSAVVLTLQGPCFGQIILSGSGRLDPIVQSLESGVVANQGGLFYQSAEQRYNDIRQNSQSRLQKLMYSLTVDQSAQAKVQKR